MRAKISQVESEKLLEPRLVVFIAGYALFLEWVEKPVWEFPMWYNWISRVSGAPGHRFDPQKGIVN